MDSIKPPKYFKLPYLNYVMTNYKKGRRFEYRVCEVFREYGFEAVRKAGSSPYDISVMKDGRVLFLVDAKKTSQKKCIYVSKSDIEKIVREADAVGAEPLIIYGFRYSPVFVSFPREFLKTEGSAKLEGGLKLKDFLESFVKL